MRNFNAPTPIFWNCTGIAIAILSTGMAWSIIQSDNFEVQFAEYRLRNGHAIDRVRAVAEDLAADTKQSPIPKQKKQKLLQELNESQEILEQAEDDILTDREEFAASENGI